MALDALDKIYIDQAMERNRIQFRDEIGPFFKDLQKQNQEHLSKLLEETEQNTDLLREQIRQDNDHAMDVYREATQDDIKKVLEAVNGRPTEERVREIFQEEIRPIVRQEVRMMLKAA